MHILTYSHLSKHSTETQEALSAAQAGITYQWSLPHTNVMGNQERQGWCTWLAVTRWHFFLQVVGLPYHMATLASLDIL